MINQCVQFSNAAELAATIPGSRRSGKGWMAHCPCHPDRTPSLSIRDGESAVLVTCFSKRCSYAEVMQAINGEYIGSDQPARTTTDDRRDQSERARSIWSSSQPVVSGDPVRQYLTKTRRLALESIPACIRYHPQLEYWEANPIQMPGEPEWILIGSFPAMVAAFTDLAGDVVAIHRTYLTTDGQKAFGKNSDRDPRKTLGNVRGAAIRLFPEAPRVGVAEGIETALAASLLFGVPTWAAYSTSNLQNLLIPDSVTEVIIFADRDRNEAGEIAAKKLATRLVAEGRRCKIVAPDVPGTDWADVLEETNEQQ